jgi:hypothetical protein
MFLEARGKALAGQERKSDPTAVRNLWMAVNAPDGHPDKIYNTAPIFEAVRDGRINTTDANQLNTMVANQKDENNRTLGSRLYGMSNDLGQALRSNYKVQARANLDPTLIPQIQNEYRTRVEERIAVLRKENKDPSGVFTRGHKDYVGSPDFVNSVVESVMSQSQRGTAPAGSPDRIVERDGRMWEFQGGNPADKASWKDIGPANAAPVQPIRGVE